MSENLLMTLVCAHCSHSYRSYQTTASWAKAEASTAEIAREEELNAKKMNIAAHIAADAASKRSPGTTESSSQTSAAIDQLERDASSKTNEAVRQGQRDVQDVQAAGAEYINSAIETVKTYLPTGIIGTEDSTTTKDK